MNDAHQVVAAYWAAAESRDWDTFAGLVAEQVVYEAPQARERVRGRTAYMRFNIEGFPGDWHLNVERIIGEGRHAASWVEFLMPVTATRECASSTSMRTDGSPG